MSNVEAMKSSEVGAISEGILNQIKKTKNTSVKNLTVTVLKNDGKSESQIIKNMCQVWKFIKTHYNEDTNLMDKITVHQNDDLLKDIHAEKKASGKVWMVDKMQIGKHVKNK
jgi:hypothetical protein